MYIHTYVCIRVNVYVHMQINTCIFGPIFIYPELLLICLHSLFLYILGRCVVCNSTFSLVILVFFSPQYGMKLCLNQLVNFYFGFCFVINKILFMHVSFCCHGEIDCLFYNTYAKIYVYINFFCLFQLLLCYFVRLLFIASHKFWKLLPFSC